MILVQDDDHARIWSREGDRFFRFYWLEGSSSFIEFARCYWVVFPVDWGRIFQIHERCEIHEGVVDGTDEVLLCHREAWACPVAERGSDPEFFIRRLWIATSFVTGADSLLAMTGTKISKTLLDHVFFFIREAIETWSMIVSSEYLLEVRIPCQIWLTRAKCKDSRTGIGSYSWEYLEERFFSRKYSVICFTYDFCGFQDITSSRVVSHTLII